MSELTIIQQTRLSTKERIRASELGYTTQDIEDLGLSKIRTLIKSGTVKTGKTDLQIQREEKLKLKNKNKYNKLLDKGKVLDAKWEKNVKIFNAQNDTNYTLDDFKNAKIVKRTPFDNTESRFEIKGKGYDFHTLDAWRLKNYVRHNENVSRMEKEFNFGKSKEDKGLSIDDYFKTDNNLQSSLMIQNDLNAHERAKNPLTIA